MHFQSSWTSACCHWIWWRELGKSRAVQAAQSMLGLPKSYHPSKITDTQGIKLASQMTLDFAIEDPSKTSDVAEKILIFFEKGSMVSHAGTYEPMCTFLMTMNLECMDSLASLPNR